MNIFGALSSPDRVLNEQVARQIFDIVPEDGPVIVIMDRDGNYWPSDSQKFLELNLNEPLLKEICAKINDGAEPVISQINSCGIIAAQLATEHTNCGYVIIALPTYNPESILININLIEMLLNQVGLVAKLIEKNNLLYELKIKQFSEYSQNQMFSNRCNFV